MKLQTMDVVRSIEWLIPADGDLEWTSATWLKDGVQLEGRNRRTGKNIEAIFVLSDFGIVEDC